ncbi:MAG: TatD family hydrolase [Candidatus Levybacteria bacterium]|nr:TatD family hydrolase [Candidatus Levybacteria bacterium]
MIDVHCHLNFHSFEEDYDAVIKSALGKGLTRIINVGTKIDSSQWAVDLSKKYPELYAIVGVHPHHADKVGMSDDWLSELETIAKNDKVVGIGEIGLDYFSYKSNGVTDPQLQKEMFDLQIELAHKLGLPIQIHNRLAGEDVIAMLKERKHLLQAAPGMFHCFAGTKEVLKDALDLGFFIGFDGNSTYPGLAPKETVELSELISLTPLERIVTETDSPYLTPIPHRGERNLPEYVMLVGEHIAKVKDVPFQHVVEQTTQNVYTIFSKLG